jgi:hypothetical protein
MRCRVCNLFDRLRRIEDNVDAVGDAVSGTVGQLAALFVLLEDQSRRLDAIEAILKKLDPDRITGLSVRHDEPTPQPRPESKET